MYSKDHIIWFFRYGLWNWLSPHRMKNRFIKHPWQRLTRGFDDSELWSLDYTVSKFVLPRLKEFRKDLMGTPAQFLPDKWPITDEEEKAAIKAWEDTIDKMIHAFELHLKDGEGELLELPQYDEIDEGMALFAKYYMNLWD